MSVRSHATSNQSDTSLTQNAQFQNEQNGITT